MSNKIFVGNLNFKIKIDDLDEMFAKFGEIEDSVIISDRETGRSKGFGFVTFVEEDAAKAAVEEMNEKDLDGRKITVNIAKEREESRDRPRFKRREEAPEEPSAKFYTTVGM